MLWRRSQSATACHRRRQSLGTRLFIPRRFTEFAPHNVTDRLVLTHRSRTSLNGPLEQTHNPIRRHISKTYNVRRSGCVQVGPLTSNAATAAGSVTTGRCSGARFGLRCPPRNVHDSSARSARVRDRTTDIAVRHGHRPPFNNRTSHICRSCAAAQR